MPSEDIRERTRQEWRELGFFCNPLSTQEISRTHPHFSPAPVAAEGSSPGCEPGVQRKSFNEPRRGGRDAAANDFFCS
jgi:hypothetical protein